MAARRLTAAVAAATALLAAAPALAGGGIAFNELRADQLGTDFDEYVELVGPPGASLAGLTLVVIGDGPMGSGTVEEALSLDGHSINAAGFFVIAEDADTIGGPVDLIAPINLENGDNVTYLLVDDFGGALGADLDAGDDGVLDSTPWAEIVDCVALVGPPGGGDLVYCATQVGPDGPFVPGHIFRCEPDLTWLIGPFDVLAGLDTPGQTNEPCFTPPSVQLGVSALGPQVAVAGNLITYTITVSNFGTADAANVVITDTLPAGLDFSSHTSPPGVTLDDAVAPSIVWSTPSVAAGAEIVIGLVASIGPEVSGLVTNAVEVTTTSDDDPANNADEFTTVVNPAVEAPAGVTLSEVRVDEIGADLNEYVEIRGPAGTDLTGVTYLAIGDGAGASGTLEGALSLSGLVIPADGLLLVVEDTFTLAPLGDADLVVSGNGLNLENEDNVTHLLVVNFQGSTGMDLDADEDGALEPAWSSVLDAVGIVGPEAMGADLAYGAALGFVDVGPDGMLVPAHVYRCEPDGTWTIGPADVARGADTPAGRNAACGGPTCAEDVNGDGMVDVLDLVAVILAWGTADPEADVDGSGTVDVSDLVAVILAWGGC
jgi:hypothetical protein